jgi:hypothetical protein
VLERFCLILSLATGMVLLAVLPALAESVDTAWVRRYNGPANDHDQTSAMAVDGSGNVYVTGASSEAKERRIGSDIEKGKNYTTIKYYPDGNTAWIRRYMGPSNWADFASAIAVDDSGNVYVTGMSSGGSRTGNDYATIKYYPNGDTAWVRRYNGPANEDDWAYAIAVDGSGNVYVTGYSDGGSGTGSDYATMKYIQSGIDVKDEKR